MEIKNQSCDGIPLDWQSSRRVGGRLCPALANPLTMLPWSKLCPSIVSGRMNQMLRGPPPWREYSSLETLPFLKDIAYKTTNLYLGRLFTPRSYTSAALSIQVGVIWLIFVHQIKLSSTSSYCDAFQRSHIGREYGGWREVSRWLLLASKGETYEILT